MGLISEALKKIYFFAVDVFVWLITPALYVLCWAVWIFFWKDHEIEVHGRRRKSRRREI